MEKTGQWERIKELFDAALERNPDDRAEFLNNACGSDISLRGEVESLLSAYDRSEGLSRPAVGMNGPKEAQPSQAIGPYRLVRKIGEGGMGQVWLAEQTEPLRRQVALKLIRGGLYEESLLKRFLDERQSLALMEHPAIAKVFDAGATEDGQPYFVMEYVPGEPITRYCDERNLNIKERLELFIKACEGVQHAHQKAIIHRDLKPANILVVEVDGHPTPRIIDFGLARAIGPQGAGSQLDQQTGTFQAPAKTEIMVGTPGYMSPEQAGAADIDTRSDVYSLGVVLYELLTGQLPFDSTAWKNLPVTQALKKIQDQATPRPSTKAAEKSEAASEAAAHRQSKPQSLAHQLAGDLDLITFKALSKDRQQRYGTASELAADIRRYLRDEPIEAHAPSTSYKLRKYAQRHSVGVAMISLLILLLVGFAVLQAFQLRRTARERDRANRITDFMTAMFKVPDPGEARGNQVTAREILDKASTQIDSGLAKDPELQSQMMMVMGLVYENLGLYERAESLYGKAADVRLNQLGGENDDTLKSQAALGWILFRLGRYHDSESELRKVLDTRMRKYGAKNESTLAVMGYLGVVLQDEGHNAEAESLERQVLDTRRRILGDSHPDTLSAMNHLGLVLMGEGKWAEAESLDRQQLDLFRRIEGNDSPHSLMAMENLGIVLYRENRLAEAEALDRETLATKRRVLGPDHPESIRTMNTLAAVLTDEGKQDEAQSFSEQVLAARMRILGPDHPLTLSAMSNLAEVLTRRGNYARAEQLLEQAYTTQVRVIGPNNPATALTTYNLACLKLREGKRDEALRLLRESVDHGLANWVIKAMPDDPDLKALQGDPRFTELVAYAKKLNPPAAQSAKR